MRKAINVHNICYYQDELGSTSHVADATGQLLEYYKYDLYGKPTYFDSTSQPLNSPTYGVKDLFTGQRWIVELGLYDDRNRFMSPDLGRFLQPDPIGFKGDASNLYRYCGNDWANKKDPMGLEVPGVADPNFDRGVMFFVGLGHAVVDTAKGAWGVAWHPIDTGRGLISAAKNPGPTAKAAANAIARTWKSGDEGKGRVVGNVALAVAPVGAIAKGISTAGKVGEVTNAASAINRLNLAIDLGRAEQYTQLAAGQGKFLGAAREGERLADRWGGQAADYAKVASPERTILSDGSKLDQTHAYLNIKTLEVVEPKSGLTAEPIQIETKFEGYHDSLAGDAIGNQLSPR